MKKYLIALSLALTTALAGCATAPPPDLVHIKYTVVTPDPKLFDCPIPQLTTFTKGTATIDDIKVAHLIVYLYKNNVRCHNSMVAVQKFLSDATKTVSTNPTNN